MDPARYQPHPRTCFSFELARILAERYSRKSFLGSRFFDRATVQHVAAVIFQSGAVLGHRFAENDVLFLEVFAHGNPDVDLNPFALQSLYCETLEPLVQQSTDFADYVRLRVEFGRRANEPDLIESARKRVGLPLANRVLNVFAIEGALLGIYDRERFTELYTASNHDLNPDVSAAFDLPSKGTTLRDSEQDLIPAFQRFTDQFFPHHGPSMKASAQTESP